MFAGSPLRSFNAALLRGDSQSIIFKPQENLIPNVDSERLAKSAGNDHAAVLVDTLSHFLFHDIFENYDIFSN